MEYAESLTIATPFFNEEESLKHFFDILKKINLLLDKKIKPNNFLFDNGPSD